jgi:formamidopyrimidine-DNA glycosylase
MPELPEVQTVVTELQASELVGQLIKKVRVRWPRSIDTLSIGQFQRRLKNQTISEIDRRGKYIVIDLSGAHDLLIHLRMTGRIQLTDVAKPVDKHHHIILELSDGRQLRFFDPRKFGRWYLVLDKNVILGKLGPEPLSKTFSAKRLSRMLQKKHRILKPLLLDQAFIAGLGNIYVDEALWEAALHPTRRSSSLSEKEATKLHRSIRKVLRRGIKNMGTTLTSGQTTFYSVKGQKGRNRHELNVFRQTGLPCPRCRSLIERLVVGQRSTHVCPQCQKP